MAARAYPPEGAVVKEPSFYHIYAVKVDRGQRLRLPELRPGDYYEPEILNPDQITLRRVLPPRRRVKLTKAQALEAIGKSRRRFTQSWDQLREETRT